MPRGAAVGDSEPTGSGADEPAPRRLRSVLLKTLAAVVVVAVAAAVGVVLVARQTAPGDDTAGVPPSTGTSDPGAGVVDAPEPPEPPAALAPASGAPTVTAAVLRARLLPLLTAKRLGPSRLGYAFATLDGAKPLLISGGDALVTPASTMKLLTTATALEQLGPDARFDTTVVRSPRTRRLVLVGGGDPLLTDLTRSPSGLDDYPAEASLQQLAARTARAIPPGMHSVTLSYDDSLFAGPAVSPQWEPTYVQESIVSPIAALWVNEGRQKAGLALRSADPSLAAARRFAVLLRKRGVVVTGPIVPETAPASARDVASVSSAPLSAIVEHTIDLSDNEAAEVLLRQAAIAAGRPGSFDGGVATVRATLGSLGVDLDGARIYDGSGLSRADRLPVWSLVEVLQAAARADQPELRPVVSGLPVAGFDGSLAYRFATAPAAYGVVRAKTGTLTEAGVHGLAGIAVTSDGEPIVFATVANGVPIPRTLAVRAQLDRIAAALATCC
jgi:D-alanyl-D-alanine carboxypeptidase/D-alanyl-D-alanine-endopeptidase (penicillin-binding protein 4)